MKSLFFVFSILVSLSVKADNYLDGRAFCGQFDKVIKEEAGFYVSVPVDYESPTGPKTEIYAHFIFKYDPSKPTFAYFTGGPGSPSHLSLYDIIKFYNSLPFNFLTFDQRGIACSRPAKEDQYHDLNYYSSENTARDLEEIRKFLGLKQISIYGVSYGTAPATIYCSLFQRTCKALVLEGTMFSGPDRVDLFSTPSNALVQTAFNLLSPSAQKRIIDLTEKGVLNRFFYTAGAYEIMKSHGLKGMEQANPAIVQGLNNPDDKVESAIRGLLQNLFPESPIDPSLAPLLSDDQNVNLILTCKEFGQSVSGTPQEWPQLINGIVTPASSSLTFGGCDAIGFKQEVPSTFVAKNYPVQSHVIYVQGESDVATPFQAMVEHRKTVPQSSSDMLVLMEGGHGPSNQVFKSQNTQQITAYLNLMPDILNGISPSSAEVNQFNVTGNLKLQKR